MTAPTVRVGSIVIRVDDLEKQLAFWSAALDYLPRRGDADDFVLLKPRDGGGPNVSLDRVAAKVQVPPRIHLDLYTEDQAGEVARLRRARRDRGPLGQEAGRRRLRDPGRPRGQPVLRHRRRPVASVRLRRQVARSHPGLQRRPPTDPRTTPELAVSD